MSPQWVLAAIVLISAGVWVSELVWIGTEARRQGQDPLRKVSGAAIFFVAAAPAAIYLPHLVDGIADVLERIFSPDFMDRFRSPGTPDVPRLIVAGKSIPLTQDRVQIGRFENNDLVLDHPTVSAYHAEIVLRPDGRYELMDRDSRNGTRINGTVIRSAVLKHGDQITLGALTVHYLVSAGGDRALQ